MDKILSKKDKNGMDLTEAEDIKKRWQEYTEELYKKDLHDPDNHDVVITHLEADEKIVGRAQVLCLSLSPTKERTWVNVVCLGGDPGKQE